LEKLSQQEQKPWEKGCAKGVAAGKEGMSKARFAKLWKKHEYEQLEEYVNNVLKAKIEAKDKADGRTCSRKKNRKKLSKGLTFFAKTSIIG